MNTTATHPGDSDPNPDEHLRRALLQKGRTAR